MAWYKLWSIKRDTTVIRGVQEQAFDGGANQVVVDGDGSVFRSFASILGLQPTIQFIALEIGNALTLAGPAGLGLGANDLELYFAEVDPEGTVKSTGIKVNVTDGILFPGVLQASQGGFATLGMSLIMGGNSGNAPFTIATGQTLPAEDEISQAYTLGDAQVNASSITAVQSASLDFGVEPDLSMGDGDLYPQIVHIMGYNPTMQISTENVGIIDTYDIEGDSQEATLQIQACDNCKTIAASGHKTFTIAQASVRVTGISGSQGSRASAAIMIQSVKKDGSSHPVTVS